MIKRMFLIAVALVWASSGGFAQNLVPNGSLEFGPGAICGVYGPGDFDNSINNWSSPTADGTPALFSTLVGQACWNHQPNSTFLGPPSLKGPQPPQNGDYFAGITIRGEFGDQRRDYIQVELVQPMIVGRYYTINYYISLPDSSQYASSNICALLSTFAVGNNADTVIQATPQVRPSGIISDTVNWVQITETVQADQPFRFLTFGNFDRDAGTDSLVNPGFSGDSTNRGIYYYIDACTVTEVCPILESFGEPSLCLGDTLTLTPDLPGDYSNVQYLWTTGETSESIEVMDQGFYGVQLTVNDTCIIGDTFFVDVELCPSEVEMANIFTPNNDGINDMFRPVSFSRIDDVTLLVYDRWGNQLFETDNLNDGWNGTQNGEPAPEGVYYWIIERRGRNQEYGRQAGSVLLMR
ncbi:MAG: gliding motility-associated C-terminal domain-containing protein [Bacteroidota bacterium]